MSHLFYSELNSKLKSELDERKVFFSTKDARYVDFFSSPFVDLTFIRRFDKKEFNLNNSSKSNVTQIYDFEYKNIPFPTVESVKVYNEGRYGSIRKIDIELKLYHMKQLNELESYFMIPGNEVLVTFGLSKYASDMEDKHELYNLDLSTHIYNFSYTVEDSSGAISFTINTIGEGFFASSMDLNTKLDIDVINVDKTDEEETKSNNVLSYLRALIDNYSHWGFSGYDPNTGISKFSLNPKWDYESSGDFGDSNSNYIWYITINGLIDIINKKILEKRHIEDISYDGNAISSYDENVISADPTKIVFPDKNMGNYNKNNSQNSVNFANFGIESELNNSFREQDKINLGYTLVSIDFISEVFDQITSDDQEENVPVRNFFSKIFNEIFENSGNIYDLTLTILEKKDSGKINLNIIDSNYIDDTEDTTPYIFNIMESSNIATNFSLSSELPDKMSTAMYVGGSTSKNINPKVYSFLTRESQTYYDPNIPNPTYDAETWERLKLDSKITDVKKDIKFYSEKISKNGVEDSTSSSLKSALTSYKSLNTDANWNKNLVYPLTLTVSLHGIIGFQFGNIISIDYLPDRYINNDTVNVVFMITKIEHTIENNQWITNLETQCRMRS